MPSEAGDDTGPRPDDSKEHVPDNLEAANEEVDEERKAGEKQQAKQPTNGGSGPAETTTDKENLKRKPTRASGTEPFEKWERDEMEALLHEIRGHLGTDIQLYLVCSTLIY